MLKSGNFNRFSALSQVIRDFGSNQVFKIVFQKASQTFFAMVYSEVLRKFYKNVSKLCLYSVSIQLCIVL